MRHCYGVMFHDIKKAWPVPFAQFNDSNHVYLNTVLGHRTYKVTRESES